MSLAGESLPDRYENVPLHFAFPTNVPKKLKAGTLCVGDRRFTIRPIEEFDPADLASGTLVDSTTDDWSAAAYRTAHPPGDPRAQPDLP